VAEEVDEESKTEAPTPRRREEARRQGRVPFSAELVGSAVILAGAIGLGSYGPAVWQTMMDVYQHNLGRPNRGDMGVEGARELLQRDSFQVLTALVPFMGTVLATGITISVVQVGFQINTEKLEPDFDRLNPTNGFSRLFSLQSVVRLALTLVKVVALAAVAYWVIEGRGLLIFSLSTYRLPAATTAGWAVVVRLATYLTAAVAGTSFLDYAYQRYKFEQSLKMTKQELKEEVKREEGDPQIKGRVRQLQRDRSRRRILTEVPKATVVVTNPTHYSVALRYTPPRDAAPVVIAKGTGLMARRIAELARRHSIPVLERPPLARALFQGVREGQGIPPVLFRAIAEVLAFVYRLRAPAPPPAGPGGVVQ
jgi:flagellar biosynthetic protein FlhB